MSFGQPSINWLHAPPAHNVKAGAFAFGRFGIAFETWVKDSHTEYAALVVIARLQRLCMKTWPLPTRATKQALSTIWKMHQQGETDYFTFCRHSAETGIGKWFVSLEKMTCTYYDKSGAEILTEHRPPCCAFPGVKQLERDAVAEIS